MGRSNALGKCLSCAKQEGQRYFGLKDGGECYAGNNYPRQSSDSCIDDGKGGPNSYMVYERKGWLLLL